MVSAETLALAQAQALAFGAASRRKSGVLSQYQDRPVAYAFDVLRVRLTEDQETTLESVRVNRRTIVKSSHSVGKTFVAAIAASWWFDCWPEHIGYITGPTWDQAKGLTFKQLKILRRANRLPGTILDTGIIRDASKQREGAHYIRALNAEKSEAFQGEHSAPILIIIEEGVGVPHYIWQASEGLMTLPENRLFAIGNPTEEENDFGQAAESSLWNTLSFSALNHPNIEAELQCDDPPYPAAVRLRWLYEMIEKECEQVGEMTEDHFEYWNLPAIKRTLEGEPLSASAEKWIYRPTAYFQGRVMGEFPTQADQQVIPKAWLKFQPIVTALKGVPELGCDVARFGDDRTTNIARVGAVPSRVAQV